MKGFEKITLLFTILVIAFTPLDAIEISEGSNVTFGRYLFIAMTFSAFWSGDLILKHTIGVFKTLLCFILWAFSTIVWSIDPDTSLVRVLYLIQYAVIFVVMVNVLNTPRRIKMAMLGWIFGALYIAIKTAIDFSENASHAASLYRVNLFGNPNENSFMLCYALLFSYIIDKTKYRIPSILLTAISFYAILANGARMGLILFAIALLTFCLQLWRSKLRWYVFILVPCVIGAGWYILENIPTATLMRVVGIADSIEEGKLAHREDIWAAAFDMLYENPLWCILGSGWGTFNFAITDFLGHSKGSHNFYLDLIATTGLIGFSIVMYYLWQLFIIIKKTYKASLLNYLLLFLPMISMMSTNWQARRWWFLMGAFIYMIYRTGNLTINEPRKIKN